MMDKTFYKKKAIKKLLFSISITLIYIVGSNLTIFGREIEHNEGYLWGNLSSIFTASSFDDGITLFSLGIGPWMSVLIMWRLLEFTPLFSKENTSQRVSYRIRLILSSVLGYIQALTVIKSNSYHNKNTIVIATILLSGLYILIWLSEKNSQYGLGGKFFFVLVSILYNLLKNIYRQIESNTGFGSILIVVVILVSSFVYLRYSDGQEQIPMFRIMINNELRYRSFFSLPLSPGGSMPFMFSVSINMIPQYIILFINSISPHKELESLYKSVQFEQVPGLILFFITLIIMTFGFSYSSVDFKTLSENFKKTGDYFEGIIPGDETELFLFSKITKKALVSSIVNVLIIALPIFMTYYEGLSMFWIQFIPSWIICTIMINDMRKQYRGIYYKNRYTPIL